MKLAVLSSVAWRTPPKKYGPWEQVASNVAEGMVEKGLEVTLFATADSITQAKLASVCPEGYEETPEADAKVFEAMHISHLMEMSHQFDIIHNHFDFMPLTYSRLISTPILTTIHGFSSPKIIPIYKKYNDRCFYSSISIADRSSELRYICNVYNGIDTENFTYREVKEDYLLFFGRIHPDKGTYDAINIAKNSGHRLIIAGLIQDQQYFDSQVRPHLDDEQITYVGNAGPEYRDELLGNAKALLHPVYFEEPFGLSIVEAMCCGTPVIAYPKGSMPELICDGKTGFLVKDENQATDALSNLKSITPKDCRRWVLDNFTNKIMIDRYLEAYQKVLENWHGE